MERAVELHFPGDHPAAAGHFPGNPIVPGALLLDAAIAAITGHAAPPGGIIIRNAKFLRPVRPGERLVLAWEAAASGSIRFEGRVAGEARAAFAGTIAAALP